MNSTKPDLISVIVPAYNAEKYLQQCLDSIYIQELETGLEIVVINDGSTDGTLELLNKQESEKLRIINQPNQGPLLARNAGFKAAKGNYIASLDSDDFYLKGSLKKQLNHLKKQLNHLKKHPELDMVFCRFQQFVSEDATMVFSNLERKKVLDGISYTGGIFKASAFHVNGYTEGAAGDSGNFLDWFVRAKANGLKYEIIPEILAHRRIHDSNYGRSNKQEQIRSYLKALYAKLNKK